MDPGEEKPSIITLDRQLRLPLNDTFDDCLT